MTPEKKMGVRRPTLAVVLALVMGFVMSSPVAASNFGAYNGVYFADSSDHYFYYYGASDFTVSDTRWVRANDYDPTDLATAYTSHDSSDVTVSDSASGNSYGYYQCQSLYRYYSDRCDHAHIRIYANYNPDHTTRRSTLCQEIGHSVGLQHDNSSGCMNGAVNSPYLTYHDWGHINGRY